MKLLWLITLIFIFPASASATVYFTEIAWMGSVESAHHEWIELYNNGGAVNVDGWQIEGKNIDDDDDDIDLAIDLVGTIPANSHVVLERSSDDSVAGTAFLIYTGSLVNSGATLRLKRADGSLSDQISGGTDWQNLGGDNQTKDTAQYTSAGWTTAAATPGASFAGQRSQMSSAAENSDNETESENNNSDSKTTFNQTIARSNSSKGPSVELKLPEVALQLVINASETGYVNQPIEFQSIASGIGDSLINSLQYQWNFGNGEVSDNESPQHVFAHPGKYVVTLFASYKRQEQVARHEITILPIALSLGTNRQGDLMINNESKYEVDLSNYRLKGVETFKIPPRTILLPNQSIIINKSKVGDVDESLVIIYDPKGMVVGMTTSANLLTEKPTTKPVIIDRSPAPMISAISTNREVVTTTNNNQQFGFVSNQPAEPTTTNPVLKTETKPTEEPLVALNQSANLNQSNSPIQQNWPYLALIGLILLAIFGALLTKKSN